MSMFRLTTNDSNSHHRSESTGRDENIEMDYGTEDAHDESNVVHFLLATEITRLLYVGKDFREDCQAMEEEIDEKDNRISELEARLSKAASKISSLTTEIIELRAERELNINIKEISGHQVETGVDLFEKNEPRLLESNFDTQKLCSGCSKELPELRKQVRQLESTIKEMALNHRKISTQLEISEDGLKSGDYHYGSLEAGYPGTESPLNATHLLESFEYKPSSTFNTSEKDHSLDTMHPKQPLSVQKHLKKSLAPSLVFSSQLSIKTKHKDMSEIEPEKKFRKFGEFNGALAVDTFRKSSSKSRISGFPSKKSIGYSLDNDSTANNRTSPLISKRQTLFGPSDCANLKLLDNFKTKLNFMKNGGISQVDSDLPSRKFSQRKLIDKLKEFEVAIKEENRRPAKSTQMSRNSAPTDLSNLNSCRLPNKYSINDPISQLKHQNPFSATSPQANLKHSKASSTHQETLGPSVSQSSFSRLLYKGAKDHRKRLGMMVTTRHSRKHFGSSDINN